jgi:hypothetical protein
MKHFKQYIQLIYEELKPEQKELVNSWIKGKTLSGRNLSSHLPFERGRLTFPISPSETREEDSILPEVREHIANKGYAPISATHAREINGKREQKISKLLTDNPELLKKHAVEGTSGPASLRDYVITATNHPHDVAGMSTGHRWTSCMNLEGGGNRHYLPHELTAGTHVFYLHHKDDPEMKKPVARLAVKPYTSPEGHSTLIVDQNPQTYGFSLNTERGKRNNSEFVQNVRNFVSKNYPLKDKVYQKNKSVYDDENFDQRGDKPFIYNGEVSDEDLYGLLKSPKHALAGIKHPSIKREHLDFAMKSPDMKIREHALSHPNIDPKHMDTAMGDIVHDNLRSAVLRNPSVRPEHIEKGVRDFLSDVRLNAARAKGISRDQLNVLAQDNNATVKKAALERLEAKTHAENIMRMRQKPE